MQSMRDIKQRINATQKTSQITKAMHMVSASKLKKAEKSIVSFRPLTKRLTASLARVLDSAQDVSHPMLDERPTNHTVYIIISSDRGLAGPYNANVFKRFEAYIEKHHTSHDEFSIAPLGYKALMFARRRNYKTLTDKVIQVRDDVQFIDFQSISDRFIKGFLSGEFDKVIVFHNKFINTLTQNVVHKTLLPIERQAVLDAHKEETKKNQYERIYHFEPNVSDVLHQLLPMVVVNRLYGMILESKASEHAARMTAMKSATDNANELIGDLQLQYNRARQDAITTELTDIIGGANAVN